MRESESIKASSFWVIILGFKLRHLSKDLLEKNNLIIGDYHLVPKEHEDSIVTEDNIEKWSQNGWIDLRQKQVAYWQKWLREVKKNLDSLKKNTHVLPLDKNWQHVKNEDCGEILAYIYTLQNGERRTNF